MSTTKLHTLKKQHAINDAMTGSYGSLDRGALTVGFQTSNPFEVLAGAANAGYDGSASTGSPTSSGGPLSLLGRTGTGGALTTPSRGQAQDYKLLAMQQLSLHGASPQQARPMSFDGFNMSSTATSSPSHARTQAAQSYSNGSPLKFTPRRLTQIQEVDDLQGAQGTQRREPNASQGSPRSLGRPSFSSSLRAPTMLHPSNDINATSLTGVPEPLAVQEMAFRQGQKDRGSSRDRIPSNPFAEYFDLVWAESYKLGKAFGGAPVTRPAVPSPSLHPFSPHENYSWPVLINPYTQDLEHPNGSFDLRWSRKMCEIALNSMDALIRVVCKRPHDWQKYICDVPPQVQQAMVMFPDLLNRYETLKRAAHQALGGGMPQGY